MINVRSDSDTYVPTSDTDSDIRYVFFIVTNNTHYYWGIKCRQSYVEQDTACMCFKNALKSNVFQRNPFELCVGFTHRQGFQIEYLKLKSKTSKNKCIKNPFKWFWNKIASSEEDTGPCGSSTAVSAHVPALPVDHNFACWWQIWRRHVQNELNVCQKVQRTKVRRLGRCSEPLASRNTWWTSPAAQFKSVVLHGATWLSPRHAHVTTCCLAFRRFGSKIFPHLKHRVTTAKLLLFHLAHSCRPSVSSYPAALSQSCRMKYESLLWIRAVCVIATNKLLQYRAGYWDWIRLVPSLIKKDNKYGHLIGNRTLVLKGSHNMWFVKKIKHLLPSCLSQLAHVYVHHHKAWLLWLRLNFFMTCDNALWRSKHLFCSFIQSVNQ